MYVARTPRFSSADATWLILAAKRVFVRCTAGLRYPTCSSPARANAVRAFVLYRDSPLRREALRAPAGDPSRYSLYGLDELARAGFELRHDLEPAVRAGCTGAGAPRACSTAAVRLGGGYSGDFARVLASLGELNRSDVVFSTVDTVGIPLALLGRARAREAAGRLRRDRPSRAARAAPGTGRATALRRRVPPAPHDRRVRLGRGRGAARVARRRRPAGRVRRVRRGHRVLPTRAVGPAGGRRRLVGADPRRDFQLLARARAAAAGAFVSHRRVGRQRARRSTRCPRTSASRSTSRSRASASACSARGSSRSPFATTRTRARRRPCSRRWRAGSPSVVTRTAAIARGYHLEDGVNCRLVPPGDLGGARARGRPASSTTAGWPRASGCERGRRSSAISPGPGTRTRSGACSSTPPTGRRSRR